MNPDDRHYFIDYKNRESEKESAMGNRALTEANQIEQNLSAQLILISTVLVTASLIGVSNADLHKLMTEPHKALFLMILVLQVISILSGITYYKIVEYYQAKNGLLSHKKALLIHEEQYESIADMQRQLSAMEKNSRDKNPEIVAYIQIVSIAISLVLFTILLYAMAYDVPWYSNPN